MFHGSYHFVQELYFTRYFLECLLLTKQTVESAN